MADKVHDTGGVPFHISKPNKRNLSNSSTSPKVDDKKSKVFVTPNCYAVLCSDDSSDHVFNTPINSATARNETLGPAKPNIEQPMLDKQDSSPTAPPFYISNISNFSAFTKELTRLTGPDAFTCKSTKSFLIVYPRGILIYNTILPHLKETDASFHTFQARVNRSFRVVIRNLHHSTLCTEMSVALSDEGHSVKQVFNVKNKNKCGLPLFFVDLNRQYNNNEIFKITSLLNTKVLIEKPHLSRRGLPQCHNFQNYGHTDNYCYRDPKCVKCGAVHRSEDCEKDRASPVKCALCSGDHTANFRGCPVFKRVQQNKRPSKVPSTKVPKPIPKSSPKFFAEATRTQDFCTDNFSVILSNFITNLNSIITPLITLLSSLLNTLIPKVTISP